MVRTICPSRPMRTNAFGAQPPASAAAAARLSPGRLRLSNSPPPAAAPVLMNVLRESPVPECGSTAPSGLAANRSWNMSASLDGRRGRLRRLFDRLADANIGAAATDVAGHRIVDIGIARVWIARQQRGCGHDLAGLAIATLNDFEIEPRLLNLLARWRIPTASIVVTAALPTLSMVVIQERVGAPSKCTVQAPQSAIPQPNLVPVMPNTSRSTHSRGVSPSTSAVRSTLLTLILNAMLISWMSIR